MSSWYAKAIPEQNITQGDLVFDCPVPRWRDELINLNDDDLESLKTAHEFISVDLVVITQACDLEHDKIKNVTLCPHYSLSEFRKDWEDQAKASGQGVTKKAWEKFCEQLNKGFVWNQTLLNKSDLEDFPMDFRVVDFHEVFTLPKTFLQSFISKPNSRRIRLMPPYREHLSQAFARFYMRVGLPTDIRQADLNNLF